MIRGWLYRALMKLAHRYNWHYAPPCYPEGDTQLWCQWCGFRQTIRRAEDFKNWAEEFAPGNPQVAQMLGKTTPQTWNPLMKLWGNGPDAGRPKQ